MLKELFSNRLFIGALAFFIFCVVGGTLYISHVEKQGLEELTTDEDSVKQLTEKQQQPTAKAPVGDTSQGGHWHGDEWHETPHAEQQTEAPPRQQVPIVSNETLHVENTEDTPVSPHGFGPYPEVPDDYPVKPFSWDYYKNDPPIFELMARVRIKLWKQGIHAEGITRNNGLLYPTIRGTVYVKRWHSNGASFLDLQGHPADNLARIEEILENGDTPTGVTILDFDEAGIDPYIFLNLK